MPVRPILSSDNPVLRQKSRRVRRVGPNTRQLIDDMVETMREANGVGLAAIQVGVPERIVVVQLPPELPPEENPEEKKPSPEGGQLYAVINPKLARKSRDMEDGIEGCLSIPGWMGEVSRHSVVTVKGLDSRGRRVRIKANGLLARALQHEIDHCHGILFTDYIEDPEKIWPVTEGEEEAIEAAQETPRGGAASGLLA